MAEKILDEIEAGSFESAKIRLRIGSNRSVDRNDPPEQWFDHAKLACDGLRGDYTRQMAYYDSTTHERQLYHEQVSVLLDCPVIRQCTVGRVSLVSVQPFILCDLAVVDFDGGVTAHGEEAVVSAVVQLVLREFVAS